MSIDFERHLRSEMAQAPISPRPNVVREAFRRTRRRQRATRTALAAVTATAVGVAATVAFSWRGQQDQPRVETTAYVISQMNSALAAANGDIMYVRQGGVDPSGNTSNVVSAQYWDYGNRSRMLAFYDGVRQDNWDTVTPVKQGTLDIGTFVDYKQRQVIVAPVIIPSAKYSPPGCSRFMAVLTPAPGSGLIETASLLASYMHTELSCGTAIVTWNQRFGGTEAIKLTRHLGAVTFVVWIDQATFLPLADSYSGQVKADGSQAERFGWLPPTKANLANLTGQVPPGFKTITYPPVTRTIVPSPTPAPSS